VIPVQLLSNLFPCSIYIMGIWKDAIDPVCWIWWTSLLVPINPLLKASYCEFWIPSLRYIARVQCYCGGHGNSLALKCAILHLKVFYEFSTLEMVCIHTATRHRLPLSSKIFNELVFRESTFICVGMVDYQPWCLRKLRESHLAFTIPLLSLFFEAI